MLNASMRGSVGDSNSLSIESDWLLYVLFLLCSEPGFAVVKPQGLAELNAHLLALPPGSEAPPTELPKTRSAACN